MQSIYALHQKSSDDIEKEEKFLLHSIDSIQDLYLIMLSSLIEIRKKEIIFLEASSKKHLATPEEKNPNRKFVNNAVLQLLEENKHQWFVAELPAYYAKRTLLNESILPDDIANACFAFVGGLLKKSTGNALNVDGGVAAGFLR